MATAGYSTAGFRDRGVEEALDEIAAAGFSAIELLCDAPHVEVPFEGRELDEFRSGLDRRGLRVTTVHGPMTYNVLGAPDEGWRKEKVVVLGKALRFSGELGAAGMVIHPIPNPKFVPEPKDPTLPGRMEAATRRSLDELVPVAAEAGVCMLLENLPYECHYPLLSTRELRTLVDEYPADQVGLVVDTGHAWTSGIDPKDEILAAGPRLRGMHLQDVDLKEPNDNHWLPTHGGLQWDAIRGALKEVGYAGMWTFEVIVPRHGETQSELAAGTRAVATSWGLD